MANRLTPPQLAQLLPEVERISRQREAELEDVQVKKILEELNLPSDILEDALMQLRRREVWLCCKNCCRAGNLFSVESEINLDES